MDLTHLHLLITHLPIFGVLLGVVVLTYGLYKDSHQTLLAAYLVIAIACLGGLIAYLTGEPAEETIEQIQTISKSTIESHEESAELSIIVLGILGIVSLIALVFNTKLVELNRKIAFTIMILSIICFALVARTGYLGGKIRHTEITEVGQKLNTD